MWEAVTRLTTMVLNMRASKNDGDRVLAYKCIEALILLYSYRTHITSGRSRDPSLDIVPSQHPFLDVGVRWLEGCILHPTMFFFFGFAPQKAALREEGRSLFSTLVAALGSSESSITVLTTIIGSLVTVARQVRG